MTKPVFSTIDIADQHLRAATWGVARPSIVMLHDGLGSITQWRDVPSMLAARTGRTVVAYERAGHGHSLPVPDGAWPVGWLDREAAVLGTVLTSLGSQRPLLVGHSDGGSTALLHAAGRTSDLAGVIALAPHSWVEQICVDSIVAMRSNRQAIEAGLARHHEHAHELFEAWSGVWVSSGFRSWDIRPKLADIEVPTLVAQGADDAYATEDQALLTAAAIGENAQCSIIPEVGHIMHHDDPDVVVELVAQFAADELEGR